MLLSGTGSYMGFMGMYGVMQVFKPTYTAASRFSKAVVIDPNGYTPLVGDSVLTVNGGLHIVGGARIEGSLKSRDSLIAPAISAPGGTMSSKSLDVDSLIANRNIMGTDYTRGGATLGAGDSITVTVLGVAESDYITLTYQAAKTAYGASETMLSWRVWAANTLTIYGVQNRRVIYHRLM